MSCVRHVSAREWHAYWQAMETYVATADECGVVRQTGDSADHLKRGWVRHAQNTFYAAYAMISEDTKLHQVVLGAWQELKQNLGGSTPESEIPSLLGPALAKQISKTMEFH